MRHGEALSKTPGATQFLPPRPVALARATPGSMQRLRLAVAQVAPWQPRSARLRACVVTAQPPRADTSHMRLFSSHATGTKVKKPKRRTVKAHVTVQGGGKEEGFQGRFSVALVGRPNVGKSTLFNRLRTDRGTSAQGQGRAVTHRTPGTTRDWRDAEASLAGLSFRLVDTGGVEHLTRHAGRHRGGDGDITQRMKSLTAAALHSVDAVLFLVSARDGVTPEDEAAARWLRSVAGEVDATVPPGTRPLLQRTILVANKCEGLLWSAAVEGGAGPGAGAESSALQREVLLSGSGADQALLPFAHASSTGDDAWETLVADGHRLGFGQAVPLSAAHGDGLAELHAALHPVALTAARREQQHAAAAAHKRHLGGSPLPVGLEGGGAPPRPLRPTLPQPAVNRGATAAAGDVASRSAQHQPATTPVARSARTRMQLGPVTPPRAVPAPPAQPEVGSPSPASAADEATRGRKRSKLRQRRVWNAEQAAAQKAGVGPVPKEEWVDDGAKQKLHSSHAPNSAEASLEASKRAQAKRDAAAVGLPSKKPLPLPEESLLPDGEGDMGSWLERFSAQRNEQPAHSAAAQTPPAVSAETADVLRDLHYRVGQDEDADEAAWFDEGWRGHVDGPEIEGTVLSSRPAEAFRLAPTPHSNFDKTVAVPGQSTAQRSETLQDGSVALHVDLGTDGGGRVKVSPRGAVYDAKGYLILGPSTPSKAGVKAAERAAQRAANPIVVSIIGRPNVGKSTLTNSLVGSTRVLTGPAAGVTRDPTYVPFTYKGTPFTLVDTAGMRRWGQVDTGSALEPQSVSAAQRALALSHVVVLVVDGVYGVSHQDMALARDAVQQGRPLVVALNKCDGLSDRAATRAGATAKVESSIPGLKGVEVVPISALTGNGLAGLLPAVLRAHDRWRSRVPTGYLNRWLHRLARHHPPPAAFKQVHVRQSGALRSRRSASRDVPLKLKFLSQTATRPPTFALFANREDVPESYQAFLVNSLRTEFGLWGTPIRLMPRAASNPYALGRNDSRRGVERRNAAQLKRITARRQAKTAQRRRQRKAAAMRKSHA